MSIFILVVSIVTMFLGFARFQLGTMIAGCILFAIAIWLGSAHARGAGGAIPLHLQEADRSKVYRTKHIGGWFGTSLGALSTIQEEIPIMERHPKLKGIHKDLVKIIEVASRYVDLIVFEGCRTKKKQLEYYKKGLSKTLASRHLKCAAVDVVFKHKDGKVSWSREQAIATIKYLRGIGEALGIKCLRDGSSWDKGLDVSGNKFMDGFHLEIKRNCKA